MKKRTLDQIAKWNEEIVASGIKSFDEAEDALDTMFSMGDTSLAFNPRVAAYYSAQGKRYAILETDTSEKEY